MLAHTGSQTLVSDNYLHLISCIYFQTNILLSPNFDEATSIYSIAFDHKEKVLYHLQSCKHLHLAGRIINHLTIY